jgi:hypothetical protein
MALVPDDFGVSEQAGPARLELATVRRNTQQSRIGMVKKGLAVLVKGTPLTFDITDQTFYAWAAGDTLSSFVYYDDITLVEDDVVGAPLPLEFEVEFRALLIPEGDSAEDLAAAAVVLNDAAHGSKIVRGVPDVEVKK